ncbi:uncharacterized protein LOC115022310 [Cottoperca gobio]|uniref:Uncharacterized protein LOC115022310 n=1 Tax=Cottoperca gobio TaxID=56716 RepID=A0A6J2RI48_COTGO|nr:uncharacterized protein LOC115022310 [Cottoperca gobio]
MKHQHPPPPALCMCCEKKGGLAGIFKRSASIDNLFDEEKGGLFSGLLKKTPKASGDDAEDREDQKELSASNDSLFENAKEKSIFSGMFKKTPKPAEGATTDEELSEDKKSEKTGGLAGIFKKSPKPAPRSIAAKDPLRDTNELYGSCDSLADTAEDNLGELSNSNDNLSETSATKEKKGGFAGIFRRTPKTVEHQESEDMEAPAGGGGLRRRRTIKKKKRVVSFRVKTTLPKIPKFKSSDKMSGIEEVVELQELNPAHDSTVEVQSVEMAAYPTEGSGLASEPESDELMEWWNTVKGWAEWNEASNLEDDEEMVMEQAADRVYMAARLFVRLFNQRGAALQHRILELLALADAADLFHKKTVQAAVGGGVASVAGSIATITGLILAPFTLGASIIVTAVGIGVATAGSITSATANITDTVHSNMDRKKLEKMIQGYQEEIKDIRECMEFVQAGMATLEEWDFEKYSESAAKKAMNHNLKHVMKEGGRAGKALMINTDKLISTVQILGAAGGAAKAVQAISVTTGVMSALFLALDVFFLAKDSHELRKGAKTKFATKIRDVCKELQDGLLELNKVKTQLQKTMDGIEVEEYEEIVEVEEEVEDDFESDPKKLAELEQELDLLEEKLDKKAEEEQQKKIKELEEEQQKKIKELEKENQKKNKEKIVKDKEEREEEMEKKDANTEEMKQSRKGKGEGEGKIETKLEKISDEEKEQKNEEVKAAREEVLKEQSQRGKKDKEAENRITAGKEKHESKRDQAKEDNGTNKKTDEKEKNKAGKEDEEMKSRSGDSKGDDRSGKAKYSERVKPERDSERSKSSREDEGEMKHEWRSLNKGQEAESGSTRRNSGRSDKDRPHRSERGSKHETKDTDKDRQQSERTESWRRTEDERGVRDWRAEMAKSRQGRETEGGAKREDPGKSDVRKESHRSHEAATRREREWGSSREESDPKRSHHRRDTAPHDEHRERGEEKRGSRIESARRKFERAGGEEGEGRGKRREEGERRGSERDRGHEHGHRGSRPRSKVLLEDGLNI